MSKAHYNPESEVINCVFCGRDTTSKNGYCYRCLDRGHHANQMPTEAKGRPMFHIGDNPINEIDESYLHEDDYSEESCRPRQRGCHGDYVSEKDLARRDKKRAKEIDSEYGK